MTSDSTLNLVDGKTGKVMVKMTRSDVSELAICLMYTMEYRPEEYPEYENLKSILDGWLSA